MTWTELRTLLPMVALAATPVVLTVGIAVRRSHTATMLISLLGLATAFGLLFESASTGSTAVTTLLILDRFALVYLGLLIAGAATVVLLAYTYLERLQGNHEEFYVLLLLATLGGAVLATANHFASLLLGLEILSVSLYVLISYPRVLPGNIEAGTKYLILAAFSAAFLFFGAALIYGELGTLEFTQIAARWHAAGDSNGVILTVGFGMLVVGIAFKLALVPFHMWTPDIYQGAPAPVTAFVATVSKGAVFALLLRLFTEVDFHQSHALFWIFYAVALASMLGGNLLALFQDNVKRLLAYSSIAHLGYLLVAFLASGGLVVTAVTFYLVTYFAATLAAFGVVTEMSGSERDADEIGDYRGLAWHRPAVAGVFTIALLSLAGIPLTGGFVGKFYLFAAGADSALWPLLIVFVVSSVLGLFYYLRVVGAMFASPLEAGTPAVLRRPSLLSLDTLVLITLAGVVIWLGVYPSPLIRLVQSI